MNNCKKSLTFFAVFFLLLPFAVEIGSMVHFAYTSVAESESSERKVARIKLHKIKAAVDSPDSTVQNTGDELSQFANNDRINNVEFKLFDVTEYYEKVLLNGMNSTAQTEEEKIKDILGATPAQSEAAYKATSAYFLLKSESEIKKEGIKVPDTPINPEKNKPWHTQSITERRQTFSGKEEDGIADFGVWQTTEDGRSKIYLLVETDTSHATNATTNQEETVTKAVNTTISLPFLSEDKDGNGARIKENIDIYPKNTLERISKRLLPLSEESFMYLNDGIEGNGSFSSGGTELDEVVTRSVGDLVSFEIMFPVPVDFANVVENSGEEEYLYHHLTLRDLPNQGLSFYEVDDFELGGKSIYDWEGKGKDNGLVGGLQFSAEYSRPNRPNLSRIEATRADFMIYTPQTITPENTAKLKALAGQTIVLTLLMTVNEEAPVETHINNTVGYNKVRNYDVNSAGNVPQSYQKSGKTIRTLQEKFASRLHEPKNAQRMLDTFLPEESGEVGQSQELVYKKDSEVMPQPLSKNPPPANPSNSETLDDDFEIDDSEHIVTFEKDFAKVRGGTSELILTDTAAFVLKSNTYPNEGKYYGGLDDRGLLHWVDVPKNSGELTVQELMDNPKLEKIYTTEDWEPNGKITGIVDLPGLKKGSYEVVEIKAPAGYYLNPIAKGISFEIGKDVNSDPENPNEGYGKDTYVIGATTSGNLQKIENFRRGFLPNTGVREAILFLAIGVLVISLGMYFFLNYRTSKETQEVV